MAVFQLSYVSLATRPMTPGDLVELLTQSRDKNARLGITGLLVYHNREFMQLLEGERAPVSEVYDTICKDERNRQNHVMLELEVAKRSFPDWAMAFLAPEVLELDTVPGYSRFLETGLGDPAFASDPSLARRFLLKLRDDFLRGGNS